MTASADRRRRSTILGAVAGLIGLIAIIATSIVAYATLRTSEEGRAPEVDVRDVVAFPSTPNAVIGVVDDLDRLTSVAVLTLDPAGVGGSIVTIPVNADQTNGFGPVRLPISRQPYEPGNAEHEAELVSELEPLLTLTIERSAVVGPDALTDLLDPMSPFDVDLPERVVDSDTAGSGLVVIDGERQLEADEIVEAFTAIDADGPSYTHHATDVALWTAVAGSTRRAAVEVPLDEFDRPVAPADFDDFWARLSGGDVAVRDMAIDVNAATEPENETDADFVILDRRDALLVFGSISPGLVSKPNESLSFSLVSAFDEADVGLLGDDASGFEITKASMTRRFIGEMVFEQANIVAVDLTDDPGSVPAITRIEVADAGFEEDVRAVSERFFGDAEVVVAGTITDGVDAVVFLGENFLVQREELLEIERAQAAAAAEESAEEQDDEGDGGADFDVSDQVLDVEDAATTDTVPGDE